MLALGDHQLPPPTFAFWFDAYREYRASPEFKQHMRAFGLVDFWRENGFPPMCRPIVTTSGEDDFECD